MSGDSNFSIEKIQREHKADEMRKLIEIEQNGEFEEKSYGWTNIDEYITDALSDYNPIFSAAVKIVMSILLFMTLPTIIIIQYGTDNQNFWDIISPTVEHTPPVQLFRNAIIITSIYIFTIVETLIIDNLIGIILPIFYILNIEVEGKIINFLAVLNTAQHFLRSSAVSFSAFFISRAMIEDYEFFTEDFRFGHIRTTLLFFFGVYFFALFLNKFLFSIISTSLREAAYKERILKANYRLYFLEKLYFEFRRHRKRPIVRNKHDTGAFIKETELNIDTYEGSKRIIDELFTEDINYFAIRNLFGDETEDVIEFFRGHKTALKGTEGITKAMAKKCIHALSDERVDLMNSMRAKEAIVDKLYNVCFIGVSFLSIIFLMVLLNFDYKIYFASLGPIVVGCSWLFQGTVKEMYDCYKFHLIDHNYDVGDRIIIDKEDLRVQSIDLFGTEFKNVDNRIVYYSTTTLFTKKIDNVKRSNNQIEVIQIDISDQTSYKDLLKVKELVKVECEKNTKDFTGVVFIRNLSTDLNNLVVHLAIEHKSNFQDLHSRIKRREKTILMIEDAMMSVGIAYSNSFKCTG